MNINAIIETLQNKQGQNIRATWRKTLKTRKGVSDIIEKKTSVVVRSGITYDNREIVQQMRESGELPAENAGLPWGQWKVFPLAIEHKGADYVRFYPASLESMPCKVEFFRNGIPAKREEIESLCLASEFPNRDEKPLCFTVKAENVLTVGE